MVNNKIISDITSYVGDGKYGNWYCGITAEPEKCLFERHNVSKEYDKWIYANAKIEIDARDTERHLLSLGFDGGQGGGDDNTEYVYAYKKGSNTIE